MKLCFRLLCILAVSVFGLRSSYSQQLVLYKPLIQGDQVGLSKFMVQE
ncbi:MAG: hypothetical protein FJZ75_02665 [Bacteroidetes bacterium]|nr:hypothetical protein [Bacteroidota bacterium]